MGVQRTDQSGPDTAAAGHPRSDHCDGRRFFNPDGHVNRTLRDILRWKFGSKPAPWPASVPVSVRPPPAPPADGSIAATWVGHSTFLLQTARSAVLTDPVWSLRAGPAGVLGPRRVHPPAVPLESLPRIDAILLSHDHYDHCDLPTLRRLARAWQPVVVTPLGNAALCRRAGLTRVIELDWWESCEPAPHLDVTLTPSRHWSNRLTGPRNGRLWGGFNLQASRRRVHFVGDTGYDAGLFPAIRERLGPPHLALVPIGAYEPRWFMAPLHCDPDEAVRIHLDLGAALSLAMHWGCWQLTDEPREEPVRRLHEARRAAGLPESAFQTPEPGDTVVI